MPYYFQYKCLENTHLIKEKNFILLIGKTNVGKSTLINEFLNINKENENFAEEGTGCPTPTIDFKEYFGKRNETKYVLYDTNGIQLGGENSIENSLKKFENGIKENLINCIWYCISGSCIEDQEKNLIKKLINIYSEKEILPVLIIHTKTYDEDESNLVKNELLKDENLKNKLAYLPILARKKVIGKKINKYEIDSFGLDELENSTKEEIMNKSRNSALLAKLRDIYELIINKIMSNKISNCLEETYKEFFIVKEGNNQKKMNEIIEYFLELNQIKSLAKIKKINNIFKKIKKEGKEKFYLLLDYKNILELNKDNIKKIYSDKDEEYKKKINEKDFNNLFEKVVNNLICDNKENIIEKLIIQYALNYSASLILRDINEKIKDNEDEHIKSLFRLISIKK